MAVSCSFIGGSVSAFPQLTFGLKGGLNYSRVIEKTDTSGWNGYSFAPSINVGVFADFNLTEKTSIASEFLLSDKPFGYHGNSGTSHLLYINLPVMFSCDVSNRISLKAGPQAGLLIATFGKNPEYLSAIYTNRFDLGIVAGIDYQLSQSFILAFRFEQGLANMIGREASGLAYRLQPDGDAMIVGVNLRDAGVVHHNQNFQLAVKYKLLKR
ncbi:MAG TPA: porin family protein [Chryseolinea sp.]